jgi:hypothetical protein
MTVVASKYDLKENSLYETPPWATEALIRQLPICFKNTIVWEPAAGKHKIADVLKTVSKQVITSDIVSYTKRQDFIFDFLRGGDFWTDYDCIITNPPYGKRNKEAEQFARLALKRCDGWIALLLTGKFDFGKTRGDLFGNNPRFFAKVCLLDRIQWFEGEYGNTENHAWYIWQPTKNVKKHIPATILYERNLPP